MHNSKLIGLLQTFTKEEFREFGKFIKSPYFNNRSELVRFYDGIKNEYPQFKPERITKGIIFPKVYDMNYKDVLMRKLISNMLQAAELYLSHLAFKQNQFETSRNLLAELSKRKLTNLFRQRMKKAENTISDSIHNSVYYSNVSALMHLKNEHLTITQRNITEDQRQRESDLIHHFVISRLLEIYLQLINYEKTLGHQYKMKMYKEVIEYTGNNINEYGLSIRINYFLIMLLTRGRQEDYHNLKNFKDEYKNKLDIHQLFNIYINLTNYCLDMVYADHPEFRMERFELDKEFIALDLFAQKGYFPFPYFTTAVENAAYYKDFEWANDFIRKNLKKIDPPFIKFTEDYSRALLDFSAGNFKNVINKLARVNINYARAKMQINILTLKAQYETENFESALMLIDSCRHILNHSGQIPEDRRKFYMNFIRFTGYLIDVKNKNSKVKVDELKRKIAKSGYFREKEWVEKKLEEL